MANQAASPNSLDSCCLTVIPKTSPNTYTHLRSLFPLIETLDCQLWVASLSYWARWELISCRSSPTLFLPLWMDERLLFKYISLSIYGEVLIILLLSLHIKRLTNHTDARTLMHARRKTNVFQTSAVHLGNKALSNKLTPFSCSWSQLTCA